MASNAELIEQVGELAEQLEIAVPSTEGLKNAELASMVGNLRASLTAAGGGESEASKANPRGAAVDAAEAKEAATAARADAAGEAVTAFAFTVAPGKSVSRTRTKKGLDSILRPGGIIGPGQEVTADDFKQGAKDIARLVELGVVLKG